MAEEVKNPGKTLEQVIQGLGEKVERNILQPIVLARSIKIRDIERVDSDETFYHVYAGVISDKLVYDKQKFDFSQTRYIDTSPGNFNSARGNTNYIFDAECRIPVKDLLYEGNSMGFVLPISPKCLRQAEDGFIEFGTDELNTIDLLIGEEEIRAWAKETKPMDAGSTKDGLTEFIEILNVPGTLKRKVEMYNDNERRKYFSSMVRDVAELCLLEQKIKRGDKEDTMRFSSLKSEICERMEKIQRTQKSLEPLIKPGHSYSVDARVIGIPESTNYYRLMNHYTGEIAPRLKAIIK